MRVGMLVSAAFPPQEGMGFYVWNLSRYLSYQGHQVQIITRSHPGRPSREMVDGITIWRPSFVPIYPVHVHLHAVFVDRLLDKLCHELDLLHLHSPLVKRPKTSLPTMVTVHTPMKADVGAIAVTNLHTLTIKLQAPVSISLEQDLFSHTDKLCAVAGSVAQELKFYGVDPQQVAVLGNGVDTEIFKPGPVHTKPFRPYFLTAGRLGARKGLQDLVRCAEIVTREHPKVQFLIAGSGPLQGQLKNSIIERDLTDKVILLGQITDRSRMVDLYRGALGLVHAAHYEGLPTVLIEAMACGLPAVATAVSGALDVIEDGVNGLLVPVRSPDRLAEAVLLLLKDPELGRQLGSAAQKTVEQRFAWRVVSRNYAALYAALLEGRHN